MYQDIQLSKKSYWNTIKNLWETNNTQIFDLFNARNQEVLRNSAYNLNTIIDEIVRLEEQGTTQFKTDKIKVSTIVPDSMQDGEIYFKQTEQVTEYNEPNSYYIDIMQKNGSGYDLMNPRGFADDMVLTSDAASEYGESYGYTLDAALYKAYSVVKDI